MIHEMKLDIYPFDKVDCGEKTVEVRLYDKKCRKVKRGDYIRFTCIRTGETVTARVIGLYVFDSFLSLYKSDLYGKCGVDYNGPERAAAAMYRYYNKEDEKKYGVVGIEIVTVVDIYSKGDYPASALSNFCPYSFEIDSVICGSMEGFLQSLKYKDCGEQAKVCALSGKDAKRKGRHKFMWKLSGSVYWRGKKIKRKSREFTELVQRAYSALLANEEFREALADTGGMELVHSIGKHNRRTTILTEREFVDNLNILRGKLNAEN